MEFKSILAITDFSSDGSLVLERAAQLAAAHGATLELLFMPATNPPGNVGHRRMAHATWDACLRSGLRVRAANTSRLSLKAIAAHANDADLIVMSGRKERSLKAFFTGQPAERIARLCRSPILVTTSSAPKPFERVLVAVDFAPPSEPIALLAGDLAGNVLSGVAIPPDRTLPDSNSWMPTCSWSAHGAIRHSRICCSEVPPGKC